MKKSSDILNSSLIKRQRSRHQSSGQKRNKMSCSSVWFRPTPRSNWRWFSWYLTWSWKNQFQTQLKGFPTAYLLYINIHSTVVPLHTSESFPSSSEDIQSNPLPDRNICRVWEYTERIPPSHHGDVLVDDGRHILHWCWHMWVKHDMKDWGGQQWWPGWRENVHQAGFLH